jgi:hypothetical protein
VTGSSDGPGAAGFLPEEEPEEEEGVEVDTRRPRVVTVAFWLLIAAAVLRAAVGESEPGTTPVFCVCVWFAVRGRRGLGKARIGVTAAAVWFLVVPGSRAWDFVDPQYPFGRGYAVLVIMAVGLTATGVALAPRPSGQQGFPSAATVTASGGVDQGQVHRYERGRRQQGPDQVVVERVAHRLAELLAGQPGHPVAGQPGAHAPLTRCSTRLSVQPACGCDSTTSPVRSAPVVPVATITSRDTPRRRRGESGPGRARIRSARSAMSCAAAHA